jgi:hypothetical protein
MFLFFYLILLGRFGEAIIHLYFENNVGIGNQILSIVSCIKLAKILHQPLSTNSTLVDILSTLEKYKYNNSLEYKWDCFIDASHEMPETSMKMLICPLQLSYCTNILVKGGQYFVPHLSLNPQFKEEDFTLPIDFLDDFEPPYNMALPYQGIQLRYFSGTIELYPDFLLLQSLRKELPVYISSLFPETAQKFAKLNFTVYQQFSSGKQYFNNKNHDYQALIDIAMLSRAKVLYLSPGSTFSYIASALSLSTTKVYYLSRGPMLPKPFIRDFFKQPCAHQKPPIVLSCPLLPSSIMVFNLLKCPDSITRGFRIAQA